MDNWQQRQDWRQSHHDGINDRWRDRAGDHRDWYDGDWWNRNPHRWAYAAGANWWAWAAWPDVTSWVNPGWAEPVYYNYGSNVYYQDDSVYYGDQAYAPAADYAQEAEQIATSVPADAAPAAEDWLPLGVFAVTEDGQNTGADPTLFLQLAVSKQGILSGTLQNTVTGEVKNIEGMVDRGTQRAAWTVAGQTRPVMETGLPNLTQDTAGALVHFADGTTQQWLLVRLDQPGGVR